MKKTSLATLLLAAITSTAQAQTTFGEPDCGRWSKQNSTPQKAWLVGYLSGLNAMHQATQDPEKRTDPLSRLSSSDQAFLWMDNYCRENPLKEVGNGAVELFIELLKKK